MLYTKNTLDLGFFWRLAVHSRRHNSCGRT